jgi:hypothetical protein
MRQWITLLVTSDNGIEWSKDAVVQKCPSAPGRPNCGTWCPQCSIKQGNSRIGEFRVVVMVSLGCFARPYSQVSGVE